MFGHLLRDGPVGCRVQPAVIVYVDSGVILFSFFLQIFIFYFGKTMEMEFSIRHEMIIKI